MIQHRLWLLLLPYVGLPWVAFYNFRDLTLFGFPFFYWYQLCLRARVRVLTWIASGRRVRTGSPACFLGCGAHLAPIFGTRCCVTAWSRRRALPKMLAIHRRSCVRSRAKMISVAVTPACPHVSRGIAVLSGGYGCVRATGRRQKRNRCAFHAQRQRALRPLREWGARHMKRVSDLVHRAGLRSR
jgi:hypothetical protein